MLHAHQHLDAKIKQKMIINKTYPHYVCFLLHNAQILVKILFHIPCSYLLISGAIGNNLCGKPLNRCSDSSSKKSSILLIAIIVVAVIALASIIAILFVLRRRRRSSQNKSSQEVESQSQSQNSAGLMKKETQSIDLSVDIKKGENGDLNFVKKDRETFDLQDLLKASAEVLGGGSFGSTYKAVVLNGPAVVVKRFRHMNNLGKEEFFDHMRRLGSLSHPNLLPLVAFYYRKEEKLLVYDFVENGSLASYLHGMPANLSHLPCTIIQNFSQKPQSDKHEKLIFHIQTSIQRRIYIYNMVVAIARTFFN